GPLSVISNSSLKRPAIKRLASRAPICSNRHMSNGVTDMNDSPLKRGMSDARAICDYSALIYSADLADVEQFAYWRGFVLANAIAARAGRIAPSDWRQHVRMVLAARRVINSQTE